MRPPIDHGGPVDRPFDPFPYSALEGSIIDRFDAIARRFSERVALRDCLLQMTYGEVAVLVSRIAVATAITVRDRPGPVAIVLSREVLFPVAMLGVLAAGRGFVPLDASDPPERIQLIATQSGAAAVVSAGPLARRARSLFPQGLPVVDIETIGDAVCRYPLPPPAPVDLAVIVYTSGSTGRPKGAYHNHRNLLHDVLQQTDTLHLNAEDRVALLYSPAVIAAIREIFMTLLNGASLHILPPRQLQSSGLVREIKSRGISICRTVPVLLRRMTEVLGPNESLDTVRVVGLGSQRVDWSDFDVFRRHFPAEALLIVGIGATECGGNYCHWFVDDRLRATGSRLPIGRILPDSSVTIAGDDGRPVAAGEIGEFVVASRYLALGYWRDPDLTARAFTVDPADPKTRIYKTGDMGRMRPDGLLEYVGRRDQQIKLRGHRVELGEIELALAECAGVEDAAVVVRRDETGRPRSLAAYVELSSGSRELLPRDLRSMLAKRLPSYMVPATLDVVEKLPRLPHLKIDRVALARLDADRSARSADSIANLPPAYAPAAKYQTALVRSLSRLWCEVLHLENISEDEDFFMLGGDSLGAVQLLGEVAEVYGVDLDLDVLFDEGATVAGMVKTIEAARSRVTTLDRRPASTEEKATSTGIEILDEVLRRLWLTAKSWPGVNIGVGIPIFALNPQGKLPPIFWCFNVPAEPKEMAWVLGPDRPIYAMRSLNNVMSDKRDKERFIDALAHLYTDEILRIPHSGPYFIGGNCQSGPFAESIAHLLMGQGRSVAQLSLLEYEPKAAYPGRVALFFGAQSVHHNPFFKKVAPEETWKRLHKEVVWDIIPGNHGRYFEMPNLATFMDRLHARLAEAQT